MTRAETRNRILRARQLIRQAEDQADTIAAALGIVPDDDALTDVIWNDGDIAAFLDRHCTGARS